MRTLNEAQISAAVDKAMENIRDSPAYDHKQPKSVTRDFLEQLRDQIAIELEALGE